MALTLPQAEGGRIGRAPAIPGPVPLRSLHPLVAIALFSALYLQRFGLHTAGGAFVSAGHVIVLLACLVLILLRRAAVELTSLLLLSVFLAYALAVSAAAVVLPPSTLTEVGPQSLFLLVTLYAVLCVVPVPVEDTRRVLLAYNRHMLFFGILGVLQFALQFAGFRFFSFSGLVPDAFLIEFAYNVAIPLSYGSPYFKSNGVFFLEPSFFSQFVAIALAAEVLLFRRPFHVAVYGLAIVASYSGSGLLTLATALAILSLLRPRYAGLLLALLLALALGLGLLGLVAPDVYAYYIGRAVEVRSSGSSGYLRYVTPFLILGETMHGAALLFGYGPGAAEKFRVGYEYNVNAMAKILLDYGLFGALLFFGFLVSVFVRRRAGAFLIVLCLSWYFLGGGYQLTSCVVHTIAALLVWSAWDPVPGRREERS